MKKLILTILFCFVAGNCFGAEFLVKAKESWNGQGKEVGDIVVVRPNGWKWGKRECLPNYVIIKIPDMPFEEARKYEDGLWEPPKTEDGEGTKLKERKYKLPEARVDSTKITSGIATLNKQTVETEIIEKSEIDIIPIDR